MVKELKNNTSNDKTTTKLKCAYAGCEDKNGAKTELREISQKVVEIHRRKSGIKTKTHNNLV